MSEKTLPVKGSSYTFLVSLTDQNNPLLFKANPTLAAGDVKVSVDGGSLNNITTLPTAILSSKAVLVSLSAAEMNGDSIAVIFSDVSGAEWCDLVIELRPATRSLSDMPGAVLDEAAGTHTGLIPTNLDSQISDLPTASDNAAAVMDESGVGHSGLIPTNLDVKVSSRVATLQAAVITVVGPVPEGGDAIIYSGCDYLEADGLALPWKSSSWNNLAGAKSITATLNKVDYPVTAITTGTGEQEIHLPLTNAQTTTLRSGTYRLYIEAVLSNDDIVPLVDCHCLVKEK